MIKTVLFDLDGTLIPSLEYWLQAFHETFKIFGQQHDDGRVIGSCFYRNWDEIAQEFSINQQEFESHFPVQLRKQFETPRLFDGAAEVLEHCHASGLKIGLVTSGTRDIVEHTLRWVKIDRYFGAVVAAHDTPEFKPHPAPVYRALSLLNSSPEETVFVGDSCADMLAAHAAGTRAALHFPKCSERFHPMEELLATNPHFVFHEFNDLREYLSSASMAPHTVRSG